MLRLNPEQSTKELTIFESFSRAAGLTIALDSVPDPGWQRAARAVVVVVVERQPNLLHVVGALRPRRRAPRRLRLGPPGAGRLVKGLQQQQAAAAAVTAGI